MRNKPNDFIVKQNSGARRNDISNRLTPRWSCVADEN